MHTCTIEGRDDEHVASRARFFSWNYGSCSKNRCLILTPRPNMPIFEGGGLKWWSRTTAVFVAFVVLVAVLIAACLSFDVELLRIITSQQTLKPVVMAPYWPDPVLDASGRLTLDVWPKQQPQRTIDADEKFLGYLPHSGFHNQRMALQNAMVLATYLNRTL